MKKLIGLLLYGAIIFGVTAGVGIFMAKKQSAHSGAEDAEGHGDEEEVAAEHGESEHGDDGHGSSGSGMTAARLTGHGPPAESHADQHLPVAVRTSPMTVEEIVRMGLNLKSRDEAVRKREESLREMETQQRLVMSDMATARQEVENLLAQSSDQRAAKELLLNQIIAQKADIDTIRRSLEEDKEKLKVTREQVSAEQLAWDAQKKSIEQRETDLATKQKLLDDERKTLDEEKSRVTQAGEGLKKEREEWLAEKEKINSERSSIRIDRDNLKMERDLFEQTKQKFSATTGMSPDAVLSADGATLPLDEETRQKNLKATAERVGGMTPEGAAEAIKQLANDGKEEMAMEVLSSLDSRKAGAILDAMKDETLAAKFIELMSNRNKQNKTATKQ
ncbi:MAG: hypothetical protein ACK58L_02045 [Planctomycetota bacterium]